MNLADITIGFCVQEKAHGITNRDEALNYIFAMSNSYTWKGGKLKRPFSQLTTPVYYPNYHDDKLVLFSSMEPAFKNWASMGFNSNARRTPTILNPDWREAVVEYCYKVYNTAIEDYFPYPDEKDRDVLRRFTINQDISKVLLDSYPNTKFLVRLFQKLEQQKR